MMRPQRFMRSMGTLIFFAVSLSVGSASALTLTGGEAPAPFNIVGDLVIHVPSGTLMADAVDLRVGMGSRIWIETSFEVADTLSFCTLDCDPFDPAAAPLSGAPVHVSVLGRLEGTFAIFASGDILVTAIPIPEVSSAVYLGIGLAASVLATRRRRGAR